MASLNQITLIGRLTDQPELRYTPGGKAVATFDLAVDRRAYGSQDKQTDFIPVVVWEKLAEICNEYLTKGKLVCIQGQLRTRTYEKRKAFEVLCSEMVMLGSKDGQGGGSQQQGKPAKKWASDDYPSDIGLEDIPF